MRPCRSLLPLLLALACRSAAVSDDRTEAVSLAGAPLERLEPEGEARAHYEAELAAARNAWSTDRSEDAAIWVGRHLAYLGRYRDAIEWYSARLDDLPDSHRLRRHRGHRYLSVRRFADARRDLEDAWRLCAELPDAVEPDGAPNRYGIPRGTTQTNVLYHLALARYLQGDFDGAAAVWDECLERCTNDDMRVATLNWLVHALRRAGREDQVPPYLAPVHRDMAVVENFAYHRLLLLQKGELTPGRLAADAGDGVQDATVAYGVANWSWCNGNRERARALLEEIVATTPWNAFGHVAAEADLARLR